MPRHGVRATCPVRVPVVFAECRLTGTVLTARGSPDVRYDSAADLASSRIAEARFLLIQDPACTAPISTSSRNPRPSPAPSPGQAIRVGFDRILAVHRRRPDGYRTSCVRTLSRWPCSVARNALSAVARLN
jgi:hypothetical protein